MLLARLLNQPSFQLDASLKICDPEHKIKQMYGLTQMADPNGCTMLSLAKNKIQPSEGLARKWRQKNLFFSIFLPPSFCL